MNRPLIRLMLVLTLTAAPFGQSYGESEDPAATVAEFNAAISRKDAGATLARLAKGGVQFTLRPAHESIDPDKLTAELHGYWSMIAPVLFGATKTYRRDAEIVEVRADGDVASVWANITTQSVRIGSDQARTENFSEFYLLVRSPEGWKIAAIADNRQASRIIAPNTED